MRKPFYAVLLAGLVAPLAMAADDSSSSSSARGHHMQPPAEAYTACSGKSAGDTVSMTRRDGQTVSATCRELDGKLAAMPEHPGKDDHQRPMGPPPEAVKACDGKSAGDSVSFTTRGGQTLSGTCREMNGSLAAMPTSMGKSGKSE